MTAIFGADSYVGSWVGERLGFEFKTFSAIGVDVAGELVAGVVYNNQVTDPKTGKPRSIEMSIASDNPRWCTRENLDAIFGYAFRQLDVERAQAIVHRKNKHTRQFLERLGFVYEGMARRAWPTGGDAAIYSMLKHECRWLKWAE